MSDTPPFYQTGGDGSNVDPAGPEGQFVDASREFGQTLGQMAAEGESGTWVPIGDDKVMPVAALGHPANRDEDSTSVILLLLLS